MTEQETSVACERARAALARGGAGTDWAWVERHLTECPSCSAGLARLTAAIEEQFAASRLLDGAQQLLAPAEPVAAAAPPAGAVATPDRIVPFPARVARPTSQRRRFGLGLLAAVAAAAAALVVALVAVVFAFGSSAGSHVSADRRPEFVPSLDVLPSRSDHTYYAGEAIQVCLRINQPSRIHLSVLEGHQTFDLYDADSDPGQHCFPEQVKTIRGRATLRVEVFYGTERVAREDFVLLPAAGPTP